MSDWNEADIKLLGELAQIYDEQIGAEMTGYSAAEQIIRCLDAVGYEIALKRPSVSGGGEAWTPTMRDIWLIRGDLKRIRDEVAHLQREVGELNPAIYFDAVSLSLPSSHLWGSRNLLYGDDAA